MASCYLRNLNVFDRWWNPRNDQKGSRSGLRKMDFRLEVSVVQLSSKVKAFLGC